MNREIKEEEALCLYQQRTKAVALTVVVTMGYFLVVAKTALLNAEEAIRYEMPVYGLLIILVVTFLGDLLSAFEQKVKPKWSVLIFGVLIGFTLYGEIKGLAGGKVCFLYPQDRENVDWAAEHTKEAVAYIYNPQNEWMIWDESEELMHYEQIYFISSDNATVTADERLSAEDTVYVYVMRGDEAKRVFGEFENENGAFSQKELIRELLYCDLYQLKR